MERLPRSRSWQDLDKITMVCHGSYQGYHVKNSIEPFSVIGRVLVGIHRFFSWKACRHVYESRGGMKIRAIYAVMFSGGLEEKPHQCKSRALFVTKNQRLSKNLILEHDLKICKHTRTFFTNFKLQRTTFNCMKQKQVIR